ncbi:MAG: GTPase HflX [bacterium]|nr:GTPase HflX [bacterium]
MERFILVNIVPPKADKEEAEKDLAELMSLVTTFGGATVVKVLQRRDDPDRDTFVGSGKADEIKELIKSEKISAVVLNAVVKPTQKYNLQRIITETKEDVAVWDRVDLILHIFSKHANTAEAKLQIDLAQMRHMGPRMFGLGNVLSRQGGGIGTRGIGETNTELMKRHWQREIKQTEDKLKKLTNEREKQLNRRKELGLKTVSIVGYTNAGKTSLFNILAKKQKLVENALFATLDSAVGQLYLPGLQSSILISDTIGFIQNLPPQLIDAFKSTLMESVNADVLLHVIDITDEKMEEKIKAVEDILTDLGLADKKKLYVFNKMDIATTQNSVDIRHAHSQFSPLFISTQSRSGIPDLIAKIEQVVEFM